MTPQQVAEVERWAQSFSGTVGYITYGSGPGGGGGMDTTIRTLARENVLKLCAEIRWLRAELECLEEAEAGSPAGNAAACILKGESIRGK